MAADPGEEIRGNKRLQVALRRLPQRWRMKPVAGVWRSGGRRDQLLKEWQCIVSAHAEIWPQPGIVGVIVGEWRNDDMLRFYSLAFGYQGNILAPESVDFEEVMNDDASTVV